ncbi:helix-turn-helix transcriptional regulator [Haloparvum sedimenti]|uniref:helix-turn-helix transcriptional regulator n=1 Tax=Haloparvum sedimenti TaxID=1678448 RepID=UPI00071E8E47|nr:helix-turn-helix transcriptional regulator [Haloparvum sedimenti]
MTEAETTATFAADLTAFQRDLLWALSHEGGRKGLALKDELEDYYGESLNHSRLYQNLDRLADAGLVEKRTRDRRTNEYSLTETARRALSARQAWQGGEDGE